MKSYLFAAAAAVALGVGGYPALRPADPALAQPARGSAIVEVTEPATLSAQAQMGKRGFDAVCAACHGTNGVGRVGMGPPLIHRIYEPSHHGDMAFFMAAERGVKSHHWRFGDMPPQSGLTRADMTAIIRYVREVQAANGIN
ncbi:Cytochrome c [Thalassovita litoralis]|jgi:mono/diheme cytochrome c family protein|uniref:Cytochrome c n=1 Tax=Thalassovita litoralis TaxID=1010611 RepID=A0A521DCG8_9RHOB|nr:cytochrome c [Thalassovita litoralis]SMO69494.1 Cytochrome c [Thalassovita litoralis]